jgi:disease resistance protein RPM1
VVFDFIVSKAVAENFATIISVPDVVNPDPGSKIRQLSLQNSGEIPPDLVLTNARSLHVFRRQVKIPSLSQFWLLRLMDFEDCSHLENDGSAGIGSLHLKCLRFKNAHSITKLPEELARLQHL